jgi:hypothetical protein
MTHTLHTRLSQIAIAMFALVMAGRGLVRADVAAKPTVRRDEVPITTVSDAARALYLQGRDLNEKLHQTDAHALFERAVIKDKDFALAYLGLAAVAPTTQDFFAALDHAVALVEKVSRPAPRASRNCRRSCTPTWSACTPRMNGH